MVKKEITQLVHRHPAFWVTENYGSGKMAGLWLIS
jgi:hypothetical protein